MLSLNALNALARISPGTFLARREPGDSALLAGLEPGQRLNGRVLGNLHGGEFLVELETHPGPARRQAVQMQLPASMRPGDLLNLVFVSREPRATFVIAAEDALFPSGVSSRVSDAGRFIDQLLRQPAPAPAELATLSSTGSLLAGPPMDSVQLARSLAEALGRSGLFYESHQAQWARGLRSLPRLLLEPQARLASVAGPAMIATAAAAWRTEGTETGAGGEAGIIGGERGVPAASSAAPGTAGASDPVHPAAQALVRQQLDILETRQFALQGVAWPGQTIVWEAGQEKMQDGEESGGRNPVEREKAAWRTTVRLTLPSLGEVTASLRLDKGTGCAVGVHLAAAQPGTVATLRAGVAPLADSLKAAGIELMSMQAEHDEAA